MPNFGTPEENKIANEAYAFAKSNRKSLISSIVGSGISAHVQPVSVFMAGSPGAGKTEFSQSLIERFPVQGHTNIIRLDPDEIRTLFGAYNGKNAYLFQMATSFLENKILDLALDKGFDILHDSAFAQEGMALSNVGRALNKNRKVHIYFMYQEPDVAWRVTQAREASEGRRVSKDLFMQRFIGARETTNRVKEKFPEVEVTFVRHSAEKMGDLTVETDVDSIDRYLKNRYTISELKDILA